MKYFIILISICFVLSSCNTNVKAEESIAIAESPSSEMSQDTTYKLIWHWEDDFTALESNMLKDWITQVNQATMNTLGQYQFDIHYYFHKSDGDEPVPFGHTSREKNKMGIHFYVNPSYSLEEFLADWTAPHEISHLSIPFAGKSNKWFAEGYATFLSRQVMMDMGYYTLETSNAYSLKKIKELIPYYIDNERSMINQMSSLFEKHNYPAAYWGGCSYFYKADAELRARHGNSLMNIVASYQTCCRLKDKGLMSIIYSFDEILGDTLFSNLFNQYNNGPAGEVINEYK